tara:strand:+ start:216 stop:518 length:303 start_codon:yes stop_codon:yes gene_type:complete
MVTLMVICPLCFSEYGHALLARHFLKSILNNMVEAIMMTMPVIILVSCDKAQDDTYRPAYRSLYDCTKTVLFLVYASQVDRPKMMVLFCMVLLSSYKNND